MEHAGQAKDVISMQVADEYPHLPVNPGSSLEKLTLGSFPAIEEKEFRASPYEHAWKVSKFVRDASARSKERY